MGNDLGGGIRSTLHVGQEGSAAADVVDVAVGVDEAVEAIVAPTSNRSHDAVPASDTTRIEYNEAIIRPEQDGMRERLDDRDIVGDLR